MTYEEEHHREKIGKPCRHCGHPAGAHESLEGEELDRPDADSHCRHEDCNCPGYLD